MPDEPAEIPGSVRIPCFPDAPPSVTYCLPTPERVAEIADDVGAPVATMHEYPSLHEHHYTHDGKDEFWILVAQWKTPSVRFTAQGPQTATPYLTGGDDA